MSRILDDKERLEILGLTSQEEDEISPLQEGVTVEDFIVRNDKGKKNRFRKKSKSSNVAFIEEMIDKISNMKFRNLGELSNYTRKIRKKIQELKREPFKNLLTKLLRDEEEQMEASIRQDTLPSD